MFNNNLYHILNQQSIGDSHLQFSISFIATHPIFAAHFPNRPIVPGACNVEIVRELVSLMLNAPYTISEIKNLKFIEIMVPHPECSYLFDIALAIEEGVCTAKVQILSSNQSKCFTKMSLKLIPE